MTNGVLGEDVARIIVENIKTGEQYAVITDDSIETSNDDVVVKLKPR